MALPTVDMTRDWGMDQRKMLNDPAQLQGYVQDALKRGVSQSHIESFLGENAGDYHRLKDLSVDNATSTGGSSAPGGTGISGGGAVAAGGGTSAGGGGGLGGVDSLMPTSVGGGEQALGGLSASFAMGAAAPGMRDREDPAQMGLAMAGQSGLRPLGNRQYPTLDAALAGLKKAY